MWEDVGRLSSQCTALLEKCVYVCCAVYVHENSYLEHTTSSQRDYTERDYMGLTKDCRGHVHVHCSAAVMHDLSWVTTVESMGTSTVHMYSACTLYIHMYMYIHVQYVNEVSVRVAELQLSWRKCVCVCCAVYVHCTVMHDLSWVTTVESSGWG